MEAVGVCMCVCVCVWRVQGQMSRIHAFFVQTFLIEYKNR